MFFPTTTAAQPQLIITSLPQPITAARPERSNARAKRVARSRGWSEAKPSVSRRPTVMRRTRISASLAAAFAAFRRFSLGCRHSGGCANAPPPATSTRAKALGVQPFRLDTLACRHGIKTHTDFTPITAAKKSVKSVKSVRNPTHRRENL